MSLELESNVHQINLNGAKHSNSKIYGFEDYRLDAAHLMLYRSGEEVQLTPKQAETLLALIEEHGEIVSKDVLMTRLWGDTAVEESNLIQNIYVLRKVLGETRDGKPMIETLRRRGYRFNSRLTDHPHEASAATGFVSLNGVSEPERAEQASDVQHGFVTRWRLGIKLAAWFGGTALIAGALIAVYLIYPTTTNSAVGTRLAILPPTPIDPVNRNILYEIGIAESLINRLDSAEGLMVRSLSSVSKYSEAEPNPIAAGREQKVDYVFSSNYQLADGKIKITSLLMNVSTGQVEERYKFEKEASSVFAVQEAVADDLGKKLITRFGLPTIMAAEKRGTSSEEAYRLYLQGAALVDKRNDEDVRKAIEKFEQAVQLDPNYALAYARLANALSARGPAQEQKYPKAKATIEKALAIDGNLAEAHSYLGEIKSDFEGDFAGAEREHRRAIALNPNSSIAHRMYSLLLTYLGRHDESLAEIKTAIDLEPASGLNHLMFGRSLLFDRRYDEAITELERTAEVDSERYHAHLSLSVAYRLKGDYDRAFESFVKTRILDGDKPDEINLWKITYAKSGWRGVLERQLGQAKEKEKNGKPNYNLMANLSSELGQRDEAFAYLEKAFSQNGTITMLKVHPRFDALRDDPRFDDLLKRVGLK